MYKNQLQELAQRSCFNLPSYACIREGPDHAPRFKATVNFNGEIFESPGYFSTLRQAEHAAAEVALNMLSKRSPASSLAAKILDETGVCKNLLQETAQRAGVSLPTYSTVRSGPGHLPVFTCTVEVAGMQFSGEAAKTKKQAEKNAAMTAWSALKQYATKNHAAALYAGLEANEEQEQNTIIRALATASFKEDRNRLASLSRESNHLSLQQRSLQSLEEIALHRSAPAAPAMAYMPHHVNPKWAGDRSMPFVQDGMQSRRYIPRVMQGLPAEQQAGMQNQALDVPQHMYRHTNIPIKPGMAYQPRPRQSPQQLSSDMSNVRPPMAYQPRSVRIPAAGVIGSGLPSPADTGRTSSTTSSIQSHLDEHQADDEAWLRGEVSSSAKLKATVRPQSSLDNSSETLWSAGSADYWSGINRGAMGGIGMGPGTQGLALAPPVAVRTLIPVHAAPRRSRREEEDEDRLERENEVEVRTRQVLSQLSL